MPSDRDNWFNGPSLVDDDLANIENTNEEPEYKPALDFSKAQEFKVKAKDKDEFIKGAQKEGDVIISVEVNPDKRDVLIRLIPAERTLMHVVNLLLDLANEIEGTPSSVAKSRYAFVWDHPRAKSLSYEVEDKTKGRVVLVSVGPNSWDDYVELVIINDEEQVFLHRDHVIVYDYDSSNQTQQRKLSYTQFEERNK